MLIIIATWILTWNALQRVTSWKMSFAPGQLQSATKKNTKKTKDDKGT